MVKTSHSWIDCGFDTDGQRLLTTLLILPPPLVTSDIPQLSGMEARAPGTLAVDDNGCVHLKMGDIR